MAAKLLIFSRLCKIFANYFFYSTSINPLYSFYLTSTLLHLNRTSHRPLIQLCALHTDASPPPYANLEAVSL